MECCRHILAEFHILLRSWKVDDKISVLSCRRHFLPPKTFEFYSCRNEVGPLFWPTGVLFWPKIDRSHTLAEIRLVFYSSRIQY